MLAFTLTDKKTIQITCDDAGIETLVRELMALKGSGSHVHLRSPVELSGVTPWGDPAIEEVIISHGGD